MTAEQGRTVAPPPSAHVCSWQHVRLFDNWLRPLIHNSEKLFGPYVEPGMTVLDIGCGAGWASLGLARLVGEEGRVIAVDVQPEMLAMVQQRALRKGLAGRIETRRCEGGLTGGVQPVDFAVAFWMLHEAPDPRGLLQEVHTLLRPGARLFLAEPTIHASRSDFESAMRHAHDLGFTVAARPRVLLSRAVVLAGNP